MCLLFYGIEAISFVMSGYILLLNNALFVKALLNPNKLLFDSFLFGKCMIEPTSTETVSSKDFFKFFAKVKYCSENPVQWGILNQISGLDSARKKKPGVTWPKYGHR